MANPKIPYLIAVNCDANATLSLLDLDSGSVLYSIADASGHALFDLANLENGYSNGDSISIRQVYGYALDDGEILQSEETYYGSDTITKAKISLYGNYDFASIELSADGGSNWESAQNNSEHNFTNTGSDLRYRITASSGSVMLAEIRLTYTKG